LLQIYTGIGASMDGKRLFPHLNGDNNHALVSKMETLLHFKGFWMYLEKPFSALINDNYDLMCLKKD
jgi:hypothetical protein